MASGRTLLEHEERKKPVGFFPKLFENLVTTMDEEGMNNLANIRDDIPEVIK